MSFKEKFRALLEEREMTLADFSEETGIPVKTVEGWFYRNRKPRFPMEIAKLFDLDRDYFDGCFEEDKRCL